MMLAPYGWLTLGGLAGSLALWRRMARRDPRLLTIYLAALAGALLGAKVVYFLAEGYLHLGAPDMWRQLATGKSILGGLLGGYAAVEAVKRFLGFPGMTGDLFALIVPAGVLVGRIGCWTSGCCQGIACQPAWFTVQDASGQTRWPAVPVEMLFNLLALVIILWLRRTKRLPGQHFHIYLIGYGAFRFLHEFLREEPRVLGPFTGYQIAALAVLTLGAARFISRSHREHDKMSAEEL
ncbi:MAG TPA: prolipoprotein diacylglyceryl transferase family protein [Verrucomicrobiae bacterium]|nr:prolipoprotein diacylglyceryl transferase family protein [Verrucomicrobiae bacterium]